MPRPMSGPAESGFRRAGPKCEAINPDATVRAYPERLTAANAVAILADYDFVIDGTDNFADPLPS